MPSIAGEVDDWALKLLARAVIISPSSELPRLTFSISCASGRTNWPTAWSNSARSRELPPPEERD